MATAIDARRASIGSRPLRLVMAGGAAALLIAGDLMTGSASAVGCTAYICPGGNVSGQQLAGSQLTNTVLSAVNFANSTLSGSKFTGSTLTGANFTKADMGPLSSDPALALSALAKQSQLADADAAAKQKLAYDAKTTPPADPADAKKLQESTQQAAQTTALMSDFVDKAVGFVKSMQHEDPASSAPGTPGWAQTSLENTNLSGANFTGATLVAADLRNADLTNANLSGADLSGANLTGANLAGANISGTKFTGTVGVDLSKSIAIASGGPSNVPVPPPVEPVRGSGSVPQIPIVVVPTTAAASSTAVPVPPPSAGGAPPSVVTSTPLTSTTASPTTTTSAPPSTSSVPTTTNSPTTSSPSTTPTISTTETTPEITLGPGGGYNP